MHLYADGSCQPNPGTGGWAFILAQNDILQFEGAGSEPDSTNNRMELTAVLKGIHYITARQYSKIPMNIKLLTIALDSKYVLDGLETWSQNWIKQNWKKKDGKPVLNSDLWRQLVESVNHLKQMKIEIKYFHVKGHSGQVWNEKCDKLAVQEAKKCIASSQDTE